jgi:glycosyl transferase family 25
LDIPIFVINLDRSPGRLAHAGAELAAQGLSFTRIPAVDARDLDAAATAAVFDARASRRRYFVPMHEGEIACFLSHRLAWETFLRTSDAPFAIVLEDDFALLGELAPVLAALGRYPKSAWDMIKLWSGRGRIVAAMPLDGRHRLVRHRVVPLRTIGQIVTRSAAERLLAGTLPIVMPLDVQFQHWWELDLDIRSVDPPLVADASGAIGGSEIARSAATGVAARLRREFGRPLFRVMLLAKSAYHGWRRTAGKQQPRG